MPNNRDKSNAEVAREGARKVSEIATHQIGIEAEDEWFAKATTIFETAVTRAQSQLAKEVLAEMSTMAGGTHGGGLIVVSRDAAVERLHDLFQRMRIEVEGGE